MGQSQSGVLEIEDNDMHLLFMPEDHTKVWRHFTKKVMDVTSFRHCAPTAHNRTQRMAPHDIGLRAKGVTFWRADNDGKWH